MTSDFVDRNGGGESQTLEGWFLVVYFAQLFVYDVITENTEIDDLRSDGDFLDKSGEDV